MPLFGSTWTGAFPRRRTDQDLERWLQTHAAPEAPTEADLSESAYTRLRALRIELPTERELQRLVRTALWGFFHAIYTNVTAQLSEPVRTALDQLLVIAPEASQSIFEQLKAGPAAPGVKNLHHELAKLQALRALGVPADALATVPLKVIQLLKRRATNERVGEMRAHPTPTRYALLACFISIRTMEVTDDVVQMLLEIIRRMDTQTEKHLQKELLRDVKRVAGKVQLLYRVAEAVVEEPDGTIRAVLFPQVKEETFRNIGGSQRRWGPVPHLVSVCHAAKVHASLSADPPGDARRLTFRSENRFQPVIEALAVIKQSLNTKGPYLPDDVPLDGVVLPSWRDTVIESTDGNVQINRQYYELCVLRRLERALKCKEVWVEGPIRCAIPARICLLIGNRRNSGPPTIRRFHNRWRSPPSWILRERLTQALTQFNHDLPRNPHVHLTTPAANEDRRLFAVDRLTAQPEPHSLGRIKDLINQRYGMVDLLDIFVEADRLAEFTQFFTHSGPRKCAPVRSCGRSCS